MDFGSMNKDFFVLVVDVLVYQVLHVKTVRQCGKILATFDLSGYARRQAQEGGYTVLL